MHIYVCPYCDPCEKARLVKIIAENINCKYDKEDSCEEKHKCKEILKCKKCKEGWTINKKFL